MMVIYKFGVWDQQLLSCLLLFLPYLVTISAQRTCTHLAARDGETEFIMSPNYPNNYQSDTTKCWIIEAAYPSHRVQLETVDFQLQVDGYCTHDFLEIREGSRQGALISKYCSSRRPQVTSSGRALYLRFVTDHTLTDRGFKLKYTSVKSTADANENVNQEQSASDSDDSSTDWTVSPNLHLLIIACVVGFIFVVCLGTVVVAMKADKEPKSKKRNQRTSPSQASSQQELATHIQIEQTTHNEMSYGTLEPSAPPADVPAHYGNSNPSSHLETLPPSYTVAMREDRERPILAYGNDTFGMN